jgi:hypothetical protein
MSKPTRLTGRCHCGDVHYEVAAEPLMSMVCHCSDCSRIGGAVGHSAFVVARDAVKVTGEIAWYESPGDSGKMVRRGFCPRCGTRLIGFPELAPQLAGISALSLDDTSNYRPQMNIHTKSAAPWTVLDKALPAFEALPPVPGQ